MNKKTPIYVLAIILLTLILSACSVVDSVLPQPTETAVVPTATTAPSAEAVLGLATVESVDVLILESFPVQINAQVSGVFPDNCTTINDIVTQRVGNNFNVVVTAGQEAGAGCSAGEVVFEETIPLDVAGLEAGTYTVDVNGVQGSFTLDIDNVPQEDPATATAEPTATPEELFSINGRVWHDLCFGISGDSSAPPEGCIAAEDGGLIANGLLEDEPGIEGVLVDLGAGTCPAAETIVTASTDAEGNFSFDDLAAGDYCLSVDTAGLQNEAILMPGRWSQPAAGAEVGVTVGAGEAVQEIILGWDYELLPIDLTNCTNSIQFVDDLSVPDDTVFPPGASFTKRWQVRNSGTCPWSTEYAVVFVGGDLMDAAETITLTEQVDVGQPLEIAVDMVAPAEEGTYRGNWQIANAEGEPFGIGGNIEDAFWLQIVVEVGAAPPATPLPNSAAIGGVVWDDFCINSNPGRGCVESEFTAGVFVADGAFDALEVGLVGITINLAEGACPGDGTLPVGTAVLETALTDEDGGYLFDGLADGTYCIFMPALAPENVDLLIPGNWTWPATGVGQYSFILDPGEQALDLDFGWDFAD